MLARDLQIELTPDTLIFFIKGEKCGGFIDKDDESVVRIPKRTPVNLKYEENGMLCVSAYFGPRKHEARQFQNQMMRYSKEWESFTADISFTNSSQPSAIDILSMSPEKEIIDLPRLKKLDLRLWRAQLSSYWGAEDFSENLYSMPSLQVLNCVNIVPNINTTLGITTCSIAFEGVVELNGVFGKLSMLPNLETLSLSFEEIRQQHSESAVFESLKKLELKLQVQNSGGYGKFPETIQQLHLPLLDTLVYEFKRLPSLPEGMSSRILGAVARPEQHFIPRKDNIPLLKNVSVKLLDIREYNNTIKDLLAWFPHISNLKIDYHGFEHDRPYAGHCGSITQTCKLKLLTIVDRGRVFADDFVGILSHVRHIPGMEDFKGVCFEIPETTKHRSFEEKWIKEFRTYFGPEFGPVGKDYHNYSYDKPKGAEIFPGVWKHFRDTGRCL